MDQALNNAKGNAKKSELAILLRNKVIEPKEKFIMWLLTPKENRQPTTQARLAKIIGVDPSTISDWKRDADFASMFGERLIRTGLVEYMPKIFRALFDKAISGDLEAIEMAIWIFLKISRPKPGQGSVDQSTRDNNIAVFIGGKPAESLPIGYVRAEDRKATQ